MQVLTGPEVE